MSYINKFRRLAEVAAVDLSPSALEKFIDRAAAGLEFRDVEVLALIAALEDARAARTASEERVRAVVRDAIRDAIAIAINSVDRIDIGAMIDAIATRAAKQLAGAGLSEPELRGLQLMRRHLDEAGHDWRGGTAMTDVQAARDLLDRLLARSTP